METLENPVLKGADEMAKLEALAADVDAGRPVELPPSADKSEPRATDKTEPESTSSPDTTLERQTTEDRPCDAQGRFTKREDGTDIPEAERQPAEQPKPDSSDVAKADAKPESAYQKAQKEAERRDRSWKQLEEEKERVRAEAQRLEQERQQWLYEREQAQQRNGTQDRQQPQYTSKDYADFADECTKKAREARIAGDYEEAEKQIELASRATQASREAIQRETVTSQQSYQQQMLEHLRYDADEAMRREPELQDRNSPLGQETSRVLEEFGTIIEQIPVTCLANGKTLGGFSIAVEVAKLRRQASAASGLEEENKKLKDQVKELNSKLSIGGSGPTSQAPERKTFDQMPASQAMDEIERRAAQMAA